MIILFQELIARSAAEQLESPWK